MPADFVAERAAATVNDAGATSDVVTVANITAGNTLVLTTYQNGAGGPVVSSVTDNAGNTWTVDKTQLAGTNTSSVSIASGYCDAAPTSITINYSSSGTTRYWLIEEMVGLWRDSRADVSSSRFVNAAATPQTVGPTVPIAQPDELAVAAMIIATSTPVISQPFTQFTTARINNAAVTYFLCPGYQVLRTRDQESATWTWVTAANMAAAIVTYRSGPSVVPRRLPLGV